MPLEREFSMVADSTASSSPPASDASTQIKRAARTYGKRQTILWEVPPDSTLQDSVREDTIHNTAPPGLQETVPQSSPAKPMAGAADEFKSRRPCNAFPETMLPYRMEVDGHSPKFKFGWKARLAKEFDLEENNIASAAQAAEIEAPEVSMLFGSAELLQDDANLTMTESTPPPSVVDDVFSSQLSASPFESMAPDIPLSLSSPLVASGRSRRQRQRLIAKSDSEDEHPKDSSSTAPSTSCGTSFESPKSRSSSTQPTSDDELPSKVFLDPKMANQSGPLHLGTLRFEAFRSDVRETGKGNKQPPTKKELKETAKERGRLSTRTKLNIPRNGKSSKYTLESLLSAVAGQPKTQISDPIEPFTSSPGDDTALTAQRELIVPKEYVPGVELPSDSEGELPEVEELLKQERDKSGVEELKRIKMLVLKQPRVVKYDDEDDEELIVSTDPKVTVQEAEEYRRSKQFRLSTAHRIIAQHGNVKTKKTVISPSRVCKDFPAVIQNPSLTSRDLTRIILARAQVHATREIRKKEEEWTNLGGQSALKVPVPAEGLEHAVKSIAGQGLKTVTRRIYIDGDTSDGDASEEDKEWMSDTWGSVSHAPTKRSNANTETDGEFGDTEEQDSDLDETKVHKLHRNLVLDSEDENSDGDIPAKSTPRRSSTSSGLVTEDEHDKENNTKLIYNQGEDKENVRVVQPSLVSKRHSIFDLTERGRASSSPGSMAPSLAPAPSLKPVFEESRDSTNFGSSSQFSQLEPTVLSAASRQPGISEFFELGTGKARTFEKEIDECFDDNLVVPGIKRAAMLGLTQDVATDLQLQPAFQAEETLVRKAAAILEKEQAFVIEANVTKLVGKNTELYVNELGFLTQTKPVVGTPDVYRQFSPRSGLNSMLWPISSLAQVQTPSQRMPLQTLSLASASQFDSPKFTSFCRLRRAGELSDNRSPTESPTQPLRVFDAHEILRHGQELKRRQEHKRQRAELGGFLEDEAAESDDEMFGFVTKEPHVEEEEGEDLDQNLPELVDDQVMDAETEAAKLVLEKYNEHLQQDDKKIEDLHQAAVQGHFRKKRKHGVGVDDSDEESNADDNGRARRAMKRSRRSDRTDIKSLEANEETWAFADSYNQSLRDDDDDFAYLWKDAGIAEVLAGDEPDDGPSTENAQKEKTVRTVDTGEIYRAIRERAQNGDLSGVPMDPNDISWIEQDDDMANVPRVRSIDTRQRPERRQRSDLSVLDTSMGPAFRKSSSVVSDASRNWGAQARENNLTVTTRSGRGSAITGHAKARPRTRGVTVESTQLSEDLKVKPVRAVASGLLNADRSRSFT